MLFSLQLNRCAVHQTTTNGENRICGHNETNKSLMHFVSYLAVAVGHRFFFVWLVRQVFRS
jgi:hypothetical protein